MSRVLQRVKNIFRRDVRPQQLSPGSYYRGGDEEQIVDTITKPSFSTGEDDNDDADEETIGQYNVQEQTRLREQPRDTIKSFDTTRSGDAYGSDSTLPADRLNSSNSQYRGTSSGFISDIPPINTMNSPLNTNFNSTPGQGSTFSSQAQQNPYQSNLNPISKPTYNPSSSVNNYPPVMNNNQPSTISPNNNLPSSSGNFPSTTNFNQSQPSPPSVHNSSQSFGGFPPGMNPNPSGPPPSSMGGFPLGMSQNSPAPAPAPSFNGFPPGMNLNQPQSSTNYFQPQTNNLSPGTNNNQALSPFGYSSGTNSQSSHPMNDSNNFINNQQRSSTQQQQRNQDRDNISLLELDYPIENILIDANIPEAVAIKINDAVEKDRLGNAYHVHRYTVEPSSQHISYKDNKNNHRRLDRNTSHAGSRVIREIIEENQTSVLDDSIPRRRTHRRPKRRGRSNSETSLNQCIDDILHRPANIVIQTQDFNDLQKILNPFQSFNQLLPIQSSINPISFATNNIEQPIFYYTARALPNDPMRIY